MNLIDKQAFKSWEDFHRSMIQSLSVDDLETGVEKQLRIRRLEDDPEAWFKYYFPNYYKSDPAPFQIAATERMIENDRWWDERIWSRELAKSTRAMMEVIYLVVALKEMKNILLISNSQENAERLLLPFKINLEANKRIINDYGQQANLGTWTSGEFVTREGTSFRALGAGQNPRGSRNESHRVDGILFDDIDTDEECRNERRVKEKFKWIQEAVIPTVSVSGSYRIWMLGNLISQHCCIAYAMKLASYVDIVNIRDDKGVSTWPAKNSEEDIDRILSLISYSSAQKEYFNNPLHEGTVFKEMAYKAMLPLRDYKFLVCYTDPSFKDSSKNDFKATVLVGRWRDEFHILKAYVEQTSTANMIDWHYQIADYVADRVPVYYLMEANFIQDTLLREFYAEGQKRKKVIPIKGDDRKKPDKFTRIESLLEPLNRNGKLWLNERERDSKHMERLAEQFLAFEPGSRAHDDAPDAVEGAVFVINKQNSAITTESMKIFKPTRHSRKTF